MNFSDTSLGRNISHCSLDIGEWIILDFIFNVCDGHTCSTDLVDHPCPESKLSFIREYFEVSCCVFSLIMSSRYVDYLFEILNLLAPFLCPLFLCFFSPRRGENPASAHFQGNPTKCTWKFFFWLGASENNTIFSYFRNFRIFPMHVL